MNPQKIQNDEEYQAAVALVDTLMDAAVGSSEEAELEHWSLLVEEYEQEHFLIETPDPVEAVLFRADQAG